MTGQPHVVIIHRWRDRHALYASYLDHYAHRVTYVTTELGLRSIPDSAAHVTVVQATDDPVQVRAAVADLIERFGPPAHLVALNEGDLDTAALIRDEFGCGGQDSAELARFRDKLAMVAAVAAAGITVPAFADAPSLSAIREFADTHGWPVVVKPRRGTASRGVVILDGPADLDRLGEPTEPQIVQTFVSDPIFHIDGLWTGTELGPWRASRYVNTCREFTEGAALGSVEVDDPALLAELGAFTAAVAAALHDRAWVFHLEVFVGARLTFLEAGARVGGAEIPFVWREVHGIDLMSAAIDIQLGRVPTCPDPGRTAIGGWLLVPVPVPPPCEVVDVGLDLADDPGPYARVVPAPGAVVPRIGGYEHVGARFRFRGSSSREVEASIRSTANGFRLICTALTDHELFSTARTRQEVETCP